MSRLNDFYSRVPWGVTAELVRTRLKPSSRWQVYLLILMTSLRFGGRAAHLTSRQIAAATGLSERTVRAAVTALVAAGLVARPSRYGKLTVKVGVTVTPIPETELSLPR